MSQSTILKTFVFFEVFEPGNPSKRVLIDKQGVNTTSDIINIHGVNTTSDVIDKHGVDVCFKSEYKQARKQAGAFIVFRGFSTTDIYL